MVEALGQIMFQAKLQAGYLDCQLWTQTDQARTLLYVEQWATREDLERELSSDRIGMLLALMETAAQAPEFKIRTVSDQRGLEYVGAIRLGDGDSMAADSHA